MRWGSVNKEFKRQLLARNAIGISQPLDCARKTVTMSGPCLRNILQNLHEASQFLSQQKVTTVNVTSYLQTHLSDEGTVEILVDPAIAEFKKVLVTDLQSRLSILDNNVTDELLLAVSLNSRSRNSILLVILRSVME
mgnify:CR=1 FL=1